MNKILTIILNMSLLLGSVFGSSVYATDEEEPEVRYYDVEIIIFKNVRVPHNREFNLPVSSPRRDELIFDLSSAESIQAGIDLEYEMIPVSKLRLLDAVTKIAQSQRYQLLLHTAWRQPGLEKGKSVPVWIRGGRTYGSEFSSIDNHIDQAQYLQQQIDEDDESISNNNSTVKTTAVESNNTELFPLTELGEEGDLYELEGKITIALSRFLHAYVDLVLRRPRLAADNNVGNLAMQQILLNNQADTRVLNNHALSEHRRMRSKTLHYLDSPYFSMLIEIHQYKPNEEIVTDLLDTPEQETGSETSVVNSSDN